MARTSPSKSIKRLLKTTKPIRTETLVYLYATNKEEQYSYIETARAKGYSVLLADGQLDVPMLSMLEQKLEKSRFVRVDSDIIDHIIAKNDETKGEKTWRKRCRYTNTGIPIADA